MYHRDMNNNETRINAADLTPGVRFHTSNSDTVYVCEGYPHVEGGRARVVYTAPGIRAEFICQAFSTMFVVN